MDGITSFYRVLYDKKDITHILSQYLLSISYTDHLSGQTDELSIEIENTDKRWCDEWYPGYGDTLTLELGWNETGCHKIGSVEIDEIEFQLSPSKVTIRGLATGIQRAIRTEQAYAYENLTLDKVIQQVASRQNLILKGVIEPILLDRLTQQESDLEFLSKLAEEYDYAFKIIGNQLIFYAIAELEQLSATAHFKLTDISSGTIRDQIKQIPQKVEVKSHNPASGKTIAMDVKNNITQTAKSSNSQIVSSSDTSKNHRRSASLEVATAKAKAEICKANRQITTASITVKGQPDLLSGNVIELTASGQLSGRYLILSSNHNLDHTSGYITTLELARIEISQATKQLSNINDKKLKVYNIKEHQS